MKMEEWNSVIDRLIPSICQIFCDKAIHDFVLPYRSPDTRLVRGSGFVIHQDKNLTYILTNAHVVKNAINIKLRFTQTGKRDIPAELVAFCPSKDIAMLRTEQNGAFKTRILKFADSAQVKQGDHVLAGGYPLGEENIQFTGGNVSGFHADVDDEEDTGEAKKISYIQITAPINRGNSGGPLFNQDGEIIGINAAGYLFAQNIAYAIPSRTVFSIMPQLVELSSTSNVILFHPTIGIDWNAGSQHLCSSETECTPIDGIYIRDVYPSSSLTQFPNYQDDLCQKLTRFIDHLGNGEEWSNEVKIKIMETLDQWCPGRYVDSKLELNALLPGDILQTITIPNVYLDVKTIIERSFNRKNLIDGPNEGQSLVFHMDSFGQATLENESDIDKQSDKQSDRQDDEQDNMGTDTRKWGIQEVIDMIPIGAEIEIGLVRKSDDQLYQVKINRKFNPQPALEWMVREIYPKFEPQMYDHIIFAGMAIQQFMANHSILNGKLIELTHGQDRFCRHLIVTNVFSGTSLDDLNTVKQGDILTQVNGTPVSRLDHLKQLINQIDEHPLTELTFKNKSTVFLITKQIGQEDDVVRKNYEIKSTNQNRITSADEIPNTSVDEIPNISVDEIPNTADEIPTQLPNKIPNTADEIPNTADEIPNETPSD